MSPGRPSGGGCAGIHSWSSKSSVLSPLSLQRLWYCTISLQLHDIAEHTVMRYKTKEAQDAPQWRELPEPCHEQLYTFFRLVSIRVWTAYVPCLRPQSRPGGVLYLIHVFAYHHNKDRETRKRRRRRKTKSRSFACLLPSVFDFINGGFRRDDILLVVLGACSTTHAKTTLQGTRV